MSFKNYPMEQNITSSKSDGELTFVRCFLLVVFDTGDFISYWWGLILLVEFKSGYFRLFCKF